MLECVCQCKCVGEAVTQGFEDVCLWPPETSPIQLALSRRFCPVQQGGGNVPGLRNQVLGQSPGRDGVFWVF